MKKLQLLTITILATATLFAQNKSGLKNAFRVDAVKLSIGNMKQIPIFSFGSIPNIINPARPLISIEVEKNIKNKPKLRTYFNAAIGYHDYVLVERAINFNIGYGRQRKLYKSLFLNTNYQIGLQQWRRAEIAYKYNESMQQYESLLFPDKFNKSRFISKLNLDLGYSFKPLPLDIMFGVQVSAQLPHINKAIPVGFQKGLWNIGLRWHL
jgi:hypothetical protein